MINRPIKSQDIAESFLYLLKDYDCISPGLVQHVSTVWYRTIFKNHGIFYIFILFTICLRLTAVTGRCSFTFDSTQLAVALPIPTVPNIFPYFKRQDIFYFRLSLLASLSPVLVSTAVTKIPSKYRT